MKLLLLLLLPVISCQTKQYEYRTAAKVSSGHSECRFQIDEPIKWHEFTIEWSRVIPSKHPIWDEVDGTVTYFLANRYKDTVMIKPSGLDSLVIKSKYIKIAGMLFKKEDK
jgi:hypothetical protein